MGNDKKKDPRNQENSEENANPCGGCGGCAQSNESACGGCDTGDDDLAIVLRSLEKTQKERDEYLDAAKRIQADFENFKRRNATIRTDSYDEGFCEAVKNILPVMDNMERALCSANTAEDDPILCGMNMIYKQFQDALVKLGVEEIPALGQAFDHDIHNAVMKEDACEEKPANTVTQVLQKGYRYKDRIIRHSMVKVAH